MRAQKLLRSELLWNGVNNSKNLNDWLVEIGLKTSRRSEFRD